MQLFPPAAQEEGGGHRLYLWHPGTPAPGPEWRLNREHSFTPLFGTFSYVLEREKHCFPLKSLCVASSERDRRYSIFWWKSAKCCFKLSALTLKGFEFLTESLFFYKDFFPYYIWIWKLMRESMTCVTCIIDFRASFLDSEHRQKHKECKLCGA